MKKIAVSLLTTTMLMPVFIQSGDAAALKASDIKIGVKSYEAVLTKNAKVYDVDDYRNRIKVFKKNSKVTVVERRQVHGYDYIVLKGKYMLPLNNSGIKLGKSLPGKTDYFTYHRSKDVKKKLADAPKSNAYYKDYKKYALTYDKAVYYDLTMSSLEMDLTYQMHYKPEERGGVGGMRAPVKTYKEWMADKDYKMYKARKTSQCYADSPGPASIDILSEEFIVAFFNTNPNFKEYKIGKEAPYNACSKIGSDAGPLNRTKDVSYRWVKGSYTKVKEVFITPMKKYTYEDIMQNYGKPSSTRFVANGRVEHQLTYDFTAEYGFKVVVALDNYKGQVKYLRRITN